MASPGGWLVRSRLGVPPVSNTVSLAWGEWPGDEYSRPDAPMVGRGDALQLLAVYGSVRLISDQISTLPLDVFRSLGDGSQVEANKPDWLVMPTPDLSFESWCGQVLASLLLHGNAYVNVLRDRVTARIVALMVLDPLQVSVTREQGRKVFYVNGVRATGVEIVHIPAMMLPGSDLGLSPLEYARRSLNLGLAAIRYGQGTFDNDGNMPGVIESPNPMQPETKKNIAEQWRRKRQKGGRGLPGVLESGATWKPTGITSEQAQFLETRQWTAAEIAGQVYLVDPSDLGIPVAGTTMNYQNLQDRNTRRVQVTLLPWIVRLERALSSLLASPRFVKFNVDGLLRGSLKNQMDTWAVGIQNQILVPNEPRAWMDMAPLPGGDAVVETSRSNGGNQAA